MANRSAACIFSRIFKHLATHPDERNLALARWLWNTSKDYDFSPCQMSCDEALEVLNLASPPNEDGERTTYGPEGERS